MYAPPKKVLGGTAAVAAVGLVAAALAHGGGSPASTDGSGLNAFEQVRTAEDSLPPVARNEVSSVGPVSTAVGESIRGTELGGRSVFLTPASDAVCLSLVEKSLGAAVNCVPLEAVNAGSALPSYVLAGCTGPPPEEGPPVCERVTLYGVVPNGVESVGIETVAAGLVEVAVTDNTYLYEGSTTQGIKAIRYVGESGRAIRLPVSS